MTRGDVIDKAIDLQKTDLVARAQDALAAMPPPLAGEDEVVRKIRETLRESLGLLAQIACGNVPRNAQSILKAIELQLRYTQALPKQTIEHQGAVGIAVIDPFAAAPSEPAQALPTAPAARAPIVRKAAQQVIEVHGAKPSAIRES